MNNKSTAIICAISYVSVTILAYGLCCWSIEENREYNELTNPSIIEQQRITALPLSMTWAAAITFHVRLCFSQNRKKPKITIREQPA